MTVSQASPGAVPERRRSLARGLADEMWASLAISVMWLAVLLDALFGPDLVVINASGTTTVPSAIIVAFFAYLGTRVVARYGFNRTEHARECADARPRRSRPLQRAPRVRLAPRTDRAGAGDARPRLPPAGPPGAVPVAARGPPEAGRRRRPAAAARPPARALRRQARGADRRRWRRGMRVADRGAAGLRGGRHRARADLRLLGRHDLGLDVGGGHDRRRDGPLLAVLASRGLPRRPVGEDPALRARRAEGLHRARQGRGDRAHVRRAVRVAPGGQAADPADLDRLRHGPRRRRLLRQRVDAGADDRPPRADRDRAAGVHRGRRSRRAPLRRRRHHRPAPRRADPARRRLRPRVRRQLHAAAPARAGGHQRLAGHPHGRAQGQPPGRPGLPARARATDAAAARRPRHGDRRRRPHAAARARPSTTSSSTAAAGPS